jgi:hypothetical protein
VLRRTGRRAGSGLIAGLLTALLVHIEVSGLLSSVAASARECVIGEQPAGQPVAPVQGLS